MSSTTDLTVQVRTALAGTTAEDRAGLVRDLVDVVYRWAKFETPGGQGLDGHDGTEREGLGRVLTEAIAHCDAMTRARVAQHRDQPDGAAAADLVQLVDCMIAVSEQGWPGVEYSITTSRNGPTLPRHAEGIVRMHAGRPGVIKGHTYRDRLVERFDTKAWLVMLDPVTDPDVPASHDAATYYGDLRTGGISTQTPPDALCDPR